ncbi:MAG TPA: hypothetical protein VKX16_06870 [Chloroflexota bacterium]|nr:hypothetical protein [Chloroflexota bacterium]
MRDHQRFERMLGARHDLSPVEEQTLDSHLDVCQACRQLAAEYRRQDAFLRSLTFPQPARSLRAGVVSRAREPGPVRRRRLAYLGLLPVAAVLAFMAFQLRAQQPGHGPASAVRLGPMNVYDGPAPGARGTTRYGAQLHHAGTPPGPKNAPGLPSSPGLQTIGRKGGLQVDTAVEGVEFTLLTAQRTYPRNAIVPVEVRVTNRSRRTVQIVSWPPATCGWHIPYLTAVGVHGVAVSALPSGFKPHCAPLYFGPAGPGTLAPGQSLSAQQYVVLITPRLRVEADVDRFNYCKPHPEYMCTPLVTHVRGKVATFRLLPSRAPQATLIGSPPTSLALHPVPPGNPELWRTGWYECAGSAGDVGGLLTHGSRIPLHLGCDARHISLHLVAGWVGRPAAVIDYVRGMKG